MLHASSHKFQEKGFSLIELLIYVSIFAVVAGLMTSILITILKVNQKESASIETSEQLSFVMQTVSRLIRESSNIEIASANSLKLRMKDPLKDPTCLYLENNTIKLAEGPDNSNPPLSLNDCDLATASELTSNKVIADKLDFSKISNYPGHDVVSIDIQLTYNSQNPQSRTTRNLKSAIARVSAATFDSDLIPGSDNRWDLGISPNTRWQDAAFSGDLLVNGNVGIGTTSPEAKLDVVGGVRVRNSLYNTNDVLYLYGKDGRIQFQNPDDYTQGIHIFANLQSIQGFNPTGSYGTLGLNPYGGNVGIGTTGPTSLLQVSAGAQNGIMVGPETANVFGANERGYSAFGTSVRAKLVIDQGATGTVRVGATTAHRLDLITDDVIRMTVLQTTGNVGIGTTNPGTYKLNVAGTAYATSFTHSCPSGMTSINGHFCIDTNYNADGDNTNRAYWNQQSYCAGTDRRLCTFEELHQADKLGYPTDRTWSTFTGLIVPCDNVGSGGGLNDGGYSVCLNAQVYHFGDYNYMHWDGAGDTEARTTVCCY